MLAKGHFFITTENARISNLIRQELPFFRSLLKEVQIGLGVQSIDDDLAEELRCQGGDVSPIVSVEPRRRKFHKAVTVTVPLPPKYRHTPILYAPNKNKAHIKNSAAAEKKQANCEC